MLYLQAFLVGLFLFALRHDVDNSTSLVAAGAAHALNVPDWRRIRVKADDEIHLQPEVTTCQHVSAKMMFHALSNSMYSVNTALASLV